MRSRASVHAPPEHAWNHREDGLAAAACALGAIGLLGPLAVWGYAGFLALRGGAVDHSQRYLLQVLSAGSDLMALFSLLAVVLGSAGVLRRGVGRGWRWRAALGLALGVIAIAATVIRFVIAGRS